ncbi:hypothetical protein EIN_310860 [Entamoeba invadens IP1]|uniref:DUF659 domain-containing protein n=1 Tax=Entamoeba invadens IP1 TaxID=370355 RepID=L7FKT5_ENTIV|nr:hypothetical protein EIN_310860 [Entamoeba invadens IP1]ELP84984.1 hypothetical protein EIN_310860 [Entamoeba invadens IP1]|eukprot:XP_004184330.1 hypothetical protein EIN_310860 [Entamoeba invadens IP1]
MLNYNMVTQSTSSAKNHLINFHYDKLKDEEKRRKLFPKMSQRNKEVNIMLMRFFSSVGIPFSQIRNPFLVELLNFLDKSVVLSDEKTFRTTCLFELYDRELGDLKKRIKEDVVFNNLSGSISTDIMSKYNNSYITTTLHYVDKQFESHNEVLNMSPFNVEHTGKEIKTYVSQIVIDLNLNVNNIQFVADSASNNNKLSEINGNKTDCVVHTSNNLFSAVIKQIPGMKAFMKNINSLAKTLQFSQKTQRIFEELCSKNCEEPGCLATYTKTRFNSCYLSFSKLLKREKSVKELNNGIQFNEEGWKGAKEMYSLTKAMDDLYNKLAANQKITSCYVVGAIRDIWNTISSSIY